jgi:hypothetical protein
MAEIIDDTESISITLTSPTAVAKGELVGIKYPTTPVEHGANIDFEFRVKNAGGATGTFKVALYKGTARVTQTSTWNQGAGTTSGIFSLGDRAPGYGTSIAYTLKCIRIT